MLMPAGDAHAQASIQIRGRVEQASTGQPVAGARVATVDSIASATTDAGGNFAIRLVVGQRGELVIARDGYLTQRFSLPDELPDNPLVFLLERDGPEPGELVLIRGRVEDETSGTPVPGARIAPPGGAPVATTDSAGAFAIRLPAGEPWELEIERFGYGTQRFPLPDDAYRALPVLLLEPAPLEIAAVEIVAEATVQRVMRDLNARRNAYGGSAFAYDSAQLNRFIPTGTVWDFVRARAPRVFECTEGRSGLCVRGRFSTWVDDRAGVPGGSGDAPRDFAPPEIPIRVCVDGRESWGAVGELMMIDAAQVAMVEIYGRGRGGIRVYSQAYVAAPEQERQNIYPLELGC